MPEGSFAEFNDAGSVRDSLRVLRLRLSRRLLLLALNFVPLLHAIAVALFFLLPLRLGFQIAGSLAVLYLLPPITVRVLLTFLSTGKGRIAFGTREFFVWWVTFQCQVIFCRFPALEEFLRLFPGLYSIWLRLWGARIGRLTYWAPGTLILDRPFLNVGDDVVFGAGVRLNAHVLASGSQGALELILAPIVIGNRAHVGGYSLLTAGTIISEGESTRAFTVSPPFSKWQGGKRIRNPESPNGC